MNAWNHYWYGPVAAIRPYLLMKCFLILLALDLSAVRLKAAYWYGLADFNVAHFRWLDAVQPRLSSAGFVAICLLASLLAFICAFGKVNRGLLAILFTIYTLTWATSMLDLFQHHYFLSIVLGCLIFFPSIHAGKFRTSTAEGSDGQQTVLTSAWAFRLLALSIGIVYAYTTIAKLNGDWLSGATLQRFVTLEKVEPIANLIGRVGLPQDSVWQMLAVGTIFLEIPLAAGYFLAACWDQRPTRLVHVPYVVLWLMALALHGGIEIVGLPIGWFSYYMIALASVYFLSPRLLERVARPIIGLLAEVLSRLQQLSESLTGRQQVFGLLVAVVGLIAVLALTGWAVDLPGSVDTFLLLGLALIAWTAICLVRGQARSAYPVILQAMIAGILVYVATGTSRTQYEYYLGLAHEHHRLGGYAESTLGFEKARQYTRGSRETARIEYFLARSWYARGDNDAALRHLEASLHHHAEDYEAIYLRGLARLATKKVDLALVDFERTLQLEPDWPVALAQTARLLVAHPNPQLRDVQRGLALAAQADRLALGRSIDAVETLAIAFAANDDSERAVQTAERAIALARRSGRNERAEQILKLLEQYKRTQRTGSP
ncbi:MAG: hypothetical protein DWQ42_04125 [Planctomycetota bacterium]|nr:MAG: hypothetical protein DWQ42_04125 [Planctomycetota bacterium]REK46616.1 MAG: hypothetical protein DWQ46_07020 [Planctomycetota bacterium]